LVFRLPLEYDNFGAVHHLPAGTEDDLEWHADLHPVFRAIDEAEKRGAKYRRLSEMSIVFELENIEIRKFGTTDIRMIALSPSARSSQKYIEILAKALAEVGKPIVPIDDEES
jgi:hypothetical protein